MGRYNNKRTQQAAEAMKHTPSRARFSKGPPNKSKASRGKSNRNDNDKNKNSNSNTQQKQQSRGGGRQPAAAGRVLDKIANRTAAKTVPGMATAGTAATTASTAEALKYVDKSKLDRLTLSEEVSDMVRTLLVDLGVVESKNMTKEQIGSTWDDETEIKFEESTRSTIDIHSEAGLESIDDQEDEEECYEDGADEYNGDDDDKMNCHDYEQKQQSSQWQGGRAYAEYDDDQEEMDDHRHMIRGGVGLGLVDDTMWEGNSNDNVINAKRISHDEYDKEGFQKTNNMTDKSNAEPAVTDKDLYDELRKKNRAFVHLTTFLSFTEQQAARACRAIEDWEAVISDEAKEKEENGIASVTMATNNNVISLAIDWLCLHLSQDELTNGLKANRNKPKCPQPLLQHNATRYPQVKAIPHPSISIAKSITSDKDWIRSMKLQEQVRRFILLGFSEPEATKAYEETMKLMDANGDSNDYDSEVKCDTAVLLRALCILEQSVTGRQTAVAYKNEGLTETDLAYALEEREAEKEALEAIYDEHFTHNADIAAPSEDLSTGGEYILSITPTADLQEPARSSDCKLHVYLRRGYPVVEPPLLLFANQSLGPTLLRRINTELAQTVSSMIGMPAVYEVATFLAERLPTIQQEFIKEQQRREEQAAQRRLEAKEQQGQGGKAACDGDDFEDVDAEGLGRRQRAKLKSLEKAFDRSDQMQMYEEDRRQRQEKRLDQVRRENQNFRDNLAERTILKREEERIRQEAEAAARTAMNNAFNQGKSVEEARSSANEARSVLLREGGLLQQEEYGVGGEIVEEKSEHTVVASNQSQSNEENADISSKTSGKPTQTTAAFMNRLQAATGVSRKSHQQASKATPKTAAFMDRLRQMYQDAATAKNSLKDSNSETKGDSTSKSDAVVKQKNDLERYQLDRPMDDEESRLSIVDESVRDVRDSRSSRRLPMPVAVPTGDLARVMDDVITQQRDQPWLVCPEARAPTTSAERDTVTPEHLRRQATISKKLRQDLERKRKAADNWEAKVNASRDDTGRSQTNGGFTPQRFHEMMTARKRLPAFMMAKVIVDTIASNQITVVAGDTGCGKTTQVPQLVLDDLIINNHGAAANIIVTQPRRISAIGVSERIANERCEDVGETCGYSIKLEKKMSSKTRLLLCTTGILLRRLQCDPDLASISHVFVDEVHERDINTDFLIIILKDLLARRKNLKLVLMSATLNSQAFSSYFNDCPVVSIPGRAHPVQENRLEDIIEITKYQIQEESDYALKTNPNRPPRFSKSALRKRYYPKYSKETINALSIVDETIINYELLAELLEYICLNNDEGAILVFMPGMMEIQKAIEEMYKKELFQTSKVAIYPLHSSLSTAEQTAIFQVPPSGVRKIVVSTNIAETSITIEDVVFVVDTGRLKENRRDEINETPTLVECWVSRASAKQRRGRAGRVRPGIAYHMYSSHTFEADIEEYQLPEMLRVGIEDLVLQILILDLGEPTAFLSKALNPPSELAMSNSLKLLETLGAVECTWHNGKVSPAPTRNRISSEDSNKSASCENLSVTIELTALGFNLATLPVDPRVGKMMIYGSLFGCIDPALTIAASMSARSPFMSPFDKREQADEARKKFATEMSDHLTTLNAFTQWKALRQNKANNRTVQTFLRDNFLSRLTLFQMEDLRKQFSGLLTDIGFLPKHFKLQNTDSPENVNSNNLGLIKAVLCAGLYPNIIVAPRALVGNTRSDSKSKAVGECAFQSLNKGEVYLHPSTIAFSESRLDSRYCCYHEMVKTSKTYVRDCTTVSPFALLLFGGDLEVHPAQGICAVDKWLKFCIDPQPAMFVKYLRLQMERILLRKIVAPEEDVTGTPEGKALVHSINILIEKETKIINETPPDRSGGEIVRPWTGDERSEPNRRGRGRGRGGRGRGRGRGGRGRHSGR